MAALLSTSFDVRQINIVFSIGLYPTEFLDVPSTHQNLGEPCLLTTFLPPVDDCCPPDSWIIGVILFVPELFKVRRYIGEHSVAAGLSPPITIVSGKLSIILILGLRCCKEYGEKQLFLSGRKFSYTSGVF
jgi:hypothetical protein